jgi:hypothetical protein
LLAPSRMRFQRRAGGVRYLFELELAPRSAYLLQGAARYAWQHGIPPVKSLRYSITFARLGRPRAWPETKGRGYAPIVNWGTQESKSSSRRGNCRPLCGDPTSVDHASKGRAGPGHQGVDRYLEPRLHYEVIPSGERWGKPRGARAFYTASSRPSPAATFGRQTS